MGSEKLMNPNNDQTNFERKNKCRNWFVYFCSFTADVLFLTNGYSLSWSSSVIPKLKSNDTDINPLSAPITTIQVSVLAALPAIANILGLLLILTLKISDNIGRKPSIVIVAVGLVISFTTLAFVKNIYIYFVCLFVNGFCESIVLATVPVYNSEIAHDANRGKIGCLLGISMPLGALLGYSSGFASVTVITLLGTLGPGLFLLFSYFLTESPVFLASKGREVDCLKSLEKLRRTKNVEREYEKIKQTLKTAYQNRTSNVLDIFRSPIATKAFYLSIELCALQQLTGIFVLAAFMAPIFNEAGSYLSGNSFGILGGTVKVLVTFVSSFFVDRLGRRPLLLFSNVCCIINLFFLGLYFYLKHTQAVYIENLKWIPILCIILYYIGYSSGMGPVTFALIVELFSNELRAVGVATVLIINSCFLFAMLFSFPLLSELIGVHFFLWILCFCSFIGLFFLYLTIPETKGKSFAEIQKMLWKKSNTVSNRDPNSLIINA